MSRDTPKTLIGNIAEQRVKPGIYHGRLAQEYDGIGQYVLVSLSMASVSAAYKARVASGDFGTGQKFPVGTPVSLSVYRGKIEILSLGSKSRSSLILIPPLGSVPASCALAESQMTPIPTPNGDWEMGNGTNWNGSPAADLGDPEGVGGSWFFHDVGIGPGGHTYDGMTGLVFIAGQTYVAYIFTEAGSTSLTFAFGEGASGGPMSGDFVSMVTVPATLSCLEWTPSADRTGVRIAISRPGSGTIAFDNFRAYMASPAQIPEPVGISGDAGIDSHTRVPFDHVHEGRSIVRKNSSGSEFFQRRINFIEGDNVTLGITEDDANEEIDVTISAEEGTPGEGGGSELPLDAQASAGIGSGDDFAGTSLDVGWSSLQTTALTTVDASIDGWLVLGNSAAVGNGAIRGIKRAFTPSGDFTIWAKIGNIHMPGDFVGIAVFAGASDPSDASGAKRIDSLLYRSTLRAQINKWASGTLTNVFDAATTGSPLYMENGGHPSPLWLALRRVGSNFSMGMSQDGVEFTWHTTTTTIDFTVETCGIALMQQGANLPRCATIDYIATDG